MGGTIPDRNTWPLQQKKIKNQVRYESSERPWRREPMHAVMKHSLQLVCGREFGNTGAYKLLMQRFLSFCLMQIATSSTANGLWAPNDLSSLMEASRKIARRQEKLRETISTDLFELVGKEVESSIQLQKFQATLIALMISCVE